MFKMFPILLFFIFEYSVTKAADGASIKFNPPSSTVQYVFDDGQISDVRMTWHYEASGISSMPTVKLHIEIEGIYQPILTIITGRTVYVNSSYTNRITGWRNMSFASIKIHRFDSEDYTNYKLSVGHTSLEKNEESVKSLRAGVKPKKPVINCTGAQEFDSSVAIREGDSLECSCFSTGLPPPNVVWELPDGRSNVSVLKRTKIKRYETKLYTCVAENQYGFKNQSTLDLIVQYPPSVPKLTSSHERSYIGETVTFTCTADADPAPEYSWKTPDNRTLIGNGTLVVVLYNSLQFGVYRCVISNTHGQTTRSITLQQLFVPGRPRIIDSTVDTFEITIRWSTPHDNGGISITNYFIKVSQGIQVIAKEGTRNLQYKINKLKRNTTYTFCVRAENIVGEGNETCEEISTLYRGSTPAKPELTFNDDTLTIKWDKVIGKPDYYVEYKAKNDEGWTRSEQLETTIVQYVIHNIKLGRVYNVRILAEHESNLAYGEVAELFVPTIKPVTRGRSISSTTAVTSADNPVLSQTSDDIPSSVIIISVLLVLLVIVAVIVLVLWMKRRSAGDDRNELNFENVAEPNGFELDVDSKTKRVKNEKKELVYAELSDFNPNASSSTPPEPHHTDYADIAHILTSRDNDYENIPARSDEREYECIRNVNRSNSISV